jgi:glycine/sarcosine N-methyltransferase
MDDEFERIARDYDRMFARDFEADRSLLLCLFEGRGVTTVLDCACGTGVHLELLAREGFSVTGSDNSDAMLGVARENLTREGIGVELHRSAWHELPEKLPGRYDAVLCLGNSLPLALTDDAVRDSLRGMYSMLNAGGLLVVSIRNFNQELEHEDRVVAVEPEPDHFLVSVFEGEADTVRHRFFFITAATDRPSMACYSFEMNNLTLRKLYKIAKRAGIKDASVYGDKDLSEFSEHESERIIFVAEKV